MRRVLSTVLMVALMFLVSGQAMAQGNSLKIGIMQDSPGAAKQFGPLIDLFKAKGIDLRLQGYSSYPDAAIKFDNGEVDVMFAGSGVAGTMIIKKLAYPVVRPVTDDGFSTYWAVVLAPKGSPQFTGDPAYFKDKRIMCSALASSGEFYARSILGKDRELMKAASHGVAIDGLSKGIADVAIVKNRVWDKVKDRYPDIQMVGEDTGENPDNALIASYKSDKALIAKIKKVLLNLENDTSKEAMEVKQSMKITKFIPTTEENFQHTLALLAKAGVTADFNFSY